MIAIWKEKRLSRHSTTQLQSRRITLQFGLMKVAFSGELNGLRSDEVVLTRNFAVSMMQTEFDCSCVPTSKLSLIQPLNSLSNVIQHDS